MKRIVAFLLCQSLLISLLCFQSSAVAAADSYTAEKLISMTAGEGTYDRYLSDGGYNAASGKEIELTADAAQQGENGWLWSFDCTAAGRYYLRIDYSVPNAANSEIEASVLLNGKVPYNELSNFVLPIEYRNSDEKTTDIYGNEITPEQVAAQQPVRSYIFDYSGVYADALSVNLDMGANTLELAASGSEITLHEVCLVPVGNTPSYSDYAKAHTADVYEGENLIVEGEDATVKSDSILYPVSDKSSPLVSPSKSGTILLNTIGGYSWKKANQYIQWNVTVPKTGYYTLSFKARQNQNSGQKAYRALYVNGEIPFSEAASIPVEYSAKWQMITLGSDGENYLIYLSQGENQIRLQATLGDMDEVIRATDNCVSELNAMYRRLLVILGSEPDLSKDYKLNKIAPEIIEEMASMADKMEVVADITEKLSGGKNAAVATLRTLVRQLRKMNADSDKVPSEFSYFKTNIGSLGTCQATLKQQPLAIDYLVLAGKEPQLPKYRANWFTQFFYDAKEFLHSFTIDYKNIGTIDADAQDASSITVWIASGRDQAQIIRSLVSDDFTPQTGCKVKLELVAAASLLPATVAGVGPDVYIGTGDIINYAMRNAAYDLSSFGDFAEIEKRFPDSLFVPYRYLGGVYGLPTSMSFNMMYYRTDILADLGISVPKTWEDVIAMSSILSINNMSFGLPAGSSIYLMMLKQKGLDIYSEDGSVCLLDSVNAIDVFQFYTNFYNNYGFPLAYSLVNRFRTGEIPIAIDSIGMYNNLEISAPEIKGLWDFAMVPGFKNGDGTVSQTSLAAGTATMLLQQSHNPEVSWEFIKWWTSAGIQQGYGKEIESRLGASSRYTSANREAFYNSEWGKEELNKLTAQLNQTAAIEQVPGSYYLPRNLDYAYRNAVYYDKKPMDVMFDYVYKINGELREKRVELGLDVAS